MTITIRIPDKPMGKARPRFANGHAYTPSSTHAKEMQVRQIYKSNGGTLFDGAITITILAMFPIPKSFGKKQKSDAENGTILPLVKSDVDNIAKLVMDALNGIAYKDDSQVVKLLVTKRYAYDDEPCTWVSVGEYEINGR